MGGAVSAIAGPVLSLGGGLIGGSKAADASKGQAEALRAAAERASAMAAFTPYGMTTGFGTSTFADNKGSYALSPQLKAIQDRIFGAAGGYDPTQVAQAAQPIYGGASNLFNLGQQYLAKSPEQAAQDYMTQQQGLLAPGREAAQARLGTTNFGRGTGGLAVNTGTGGAPSNPAAQALYNAQARQDLELAAQAEQAGMARTKFGAGLFGTGGELLRQVPSLTTAGYGPLEAQLGLLRTTESMGQDPYKLSIDLANQYAQAGARQGQLYLEPQLAASQAYKQYQGYSPMSTGLGFAGSTLSGMSGGGMGGVGSWFGDLIGPSAAPMYSGSTDFYGGASPTVSGGNRGVTAGYSNLF
jgi:hypothetical protein